MGINFFDRKKNLIIDNLQFNDPGFDILFSGEFDDDPEPDVYEILIYNLTDNTAKKIKKNQNIILNAGYGDDVGNIFAGKIKTAYTTTDGVDKVTRITAYNSLSSWVNSGVSKTFNGPIDGETLIKEMAALAGLELGEFSLVENKIYQNGKTIFGRLSSELRKVVKECKSSLIIKNNKIIITSNSAGFETGFLLNKDTGLIGKPEQVDSEDSKSEYRITMLLNHRVTTRSIIQLDSELVKGLFTVVKGYYDEDFNMEVELITFRR